MADGVLLVISGEELQSFHNHLKYDKSYTAEILFGIKTDSYDVLGIPKVGNFDVAREAIVGELSKIKDKLEFKYPPFSSYRIKGKPLFKWALDGRLDEIEIPKKEVKIHNLKIDKIKEVEGVIVKKKILNKIKNVTGDFRQEEILKSWNQLFSNGIPDYFKIARVKIHCESGFYVRSLAEKIGESLGAGSLLFNLTRTKVGEWGLEESVWPYY